MNDSAAIKIVYNYEPLHRNIRHAPLIQWPSDLLSAEQPPIKPFETLLQKFLFFYSFLFFTPTILPSFPPGFHHFSFILNFIHTLSFHSNLPIFTPSQSIICQILLFTQLVSLLYQPNLATQAKKLYSNFTLYQPSHIYRSSTTPFVYTTLIHHFHSSTPPRSKS